MTQAALRVSGVSGLALLVACTSAPEAGGERCRPGVPVACSCGDGTDGVRECLAGRELGECTCDGSVGADPDPTGEADFLLDFGSVPLGDRASAAIPVRNSGNETLVFRPAAVEPPFELSSGTLTLAPGETGELRRGYEPAAEGATSRVVPVAVNAQVISGASRRRGVRATPPECDPAFPLPAGEVEREVLAPGAERRVAVRFAPPSAPSGDHVCTVAFEVSHPTEPHRTVALRGASWEDVSASNRPSSTSARWSPAVPPRIGRCGW
jgi:hypothetical protein